MAQTPNLGLPLIDENMTADVPRDMNALANAVDTAVTEAVAGVTVPDASTTQKGVVQLNDTTTSTSKTQAATANAVKTAYDRGSAGVTAAATAQAKADAAETPAGAQAKANTAEANAKAYTDSVSYRSLPTIAEGTDINSVVALGVYRTLDASKYLNMPDISWCLLEVIVSGGGYIVQRLTSVTSQLVMFRTRDEAGGWSTWRKILQQSDYDSLFQSVANGKQAIATAISDKGVAASGSDEFAVLANKISQIKTGVKIAQGTLGSTQSGTIANLPFTPKMVLIRTTLHAPNADAHGYVGAYLDGSVVKYLANLSVTGSASGSTWLRNVQFQSNSVYFEFNTPNTSSGAEGYFILGE